MRETQVTSDRVTLRDFAVEDAKGDAIKVKGVNDISFIRVRTEWTNGPDEFNGAYGLYPVESKNVLIDSCIAIGASDAGIYVGQSENIIVKNSRAEFNVAGIEIENSYYADVYNNHAENNTGGILVFDLPDIPQQGGHHVRVFKNKSINNNTDNFATFDSSLLLESFRILLKVFLSQLISPMLQSLSHHRTDPNVIPVTTSLDNLGDQIVLPSAFLSSTFGPPANLPFIILSPPTLVKPTIPLEPSIRILSIHPSRILPLFQAGSTLDFVLVLGNVIVAT